MADLIDYKRYPVTTLLLAINLVLFILVFIAGGSAEQVYQFGGTFGLAIKSDPSQIWRLVTANFLHFGIQHFVMNMISLYFLGQQIEDVFGSLYALLIYLLAGISGNALQAALDPQVLAAGASASLFGMFATIIVLRFVSRNRYIQELGRSYTTLLIFNIILSFLPGISLLGHLGGAIGGALCAVFFPLRYEKTFECWQALLACLAYGLLLIALLWLIWYT